MPFFGFLPSRIRRRDGRFPLGRLAPPGGRPGHHSGPESGLYARLMPGSIRRGTILGTWLSRKITRSPSIRDSPIPWGESSRSNRNQDEPNVMRGLASGGRVGPGSISRPGPDGDVGLGLGLRWLLPRVAMKRPDHGRIIPEPAWVERYISLAAASRPVTGSGSPPVLSL